MLHDTRKLDEVLAELEANSITTWVFGGWAEELHGLCVSRLHNDVDLLFPAKDFERLDALILRGAFDQIELKRSAHKRAVVLAGVMTEIFLVRQDERGAYTSFWGRTRHDWPVDVLDHRGGRRVASAAALQGYRAAHRRLHASEPVKRRSNLEGVPQTRSVDRKVLASFKSWEQFAHALDHVQLQAPVDNYGERRGVSTERPPMTGAGHQSQSAPVARGR